MLVASRHPEIPLSGLILAAPAVREGIRLRYGWNVLIGSAVPWRRATTWMWSAPRMTRTWHRRPPGGAPATRW